MKPRVHRGRLSAKGPRFAIVASRWNDFLTSKLVDGAVQALEGLGADENAVEIFMVPGAFELPPTAKRLAQTRRFDAIIALGVVIRGETPHFDYVAGQAAAGIAQAAFETGVPVMFGVVTAETLDQAINRCGGKAGNKGYEAALAAAETADLYRLIAAGNEKAGSEEEAVSHVV